MAAGPRWWLLTALVACGGDPTGAALDVDSNGWTSGADEPHPGPAQPEGPPGPATICRDVIGVQCRGHIACCDRPADRYASADECMSVLEPLCVTDLEGSAYGDGRIAFDHAAYLAALELARGAIADCAPLPVGIWDAIFVGQGAAGADCTPTDDGMDYSPMLACADGLGCVGGEESEARACQPLAADAVSCVDVECAPGLYCHAGRRGRATCRAREDVGGRCAANDDCASGHCDDGGRCGERTAAVSYCGDISYP